MALVNPILFIAAVVVISLLIYATYSLLLHMLPQAHLPSVPNLEEQVATAAAGQSNATVNASHLQRHDLIFIYERDMNGTRPDHTITPSNITVAYGSNVTLFITNNGIVPHGLEIIGPGFNVSLPEMILPGESATLNFTAPPPGNYTIFSQRSGDMALGMHANMTSVATCQYSC